MEEKYKKYLKIEVNFTDKETEYKEIVKEIYDELGEDVPIFREIEQLNKLLGRISKGKVKLGFVTEKENIKKPILKINKRVRDTLTRRLLEVNDQVAKIKTKLEKDMRDKHGLNQKN